MNATAKIADSLVAAGLADDPARLEFTPLSGGVSSDIWRVDGGYQPICVKRARSRLAVDAIWEVPVERNHYEAEFLRVVSTEVPGFAPDLLAEDTEQGLIVLPYLDPAEWQLWKPQLLNGQVDIKVARILAGWRKRRAGGPILPRVSTLGRCLMICGLIRICGNAHGNILICRHA